MKCEDRFSSGSIGSYLVDDIIEKIIDALVESEIVGGVLTVLQLGCLKLLNFSQIEEGYLYLIFILYLIAQL